MFIFRPLAVVALILWQQAAPPSTDDASMRTSLGIAAYERGEHSAALSLLRSAVASGSAKARSVDGIDPWAAVYLARMYLLGEGAPSDAALACALFRAAVIASDNQGPDVNAASKFKRVIGQDPCISTAAEFVSEVRALLSGCFLAGMTKATFELDGGWVLLDRTGVHVHIGDTRVDQAVPFFSDCQKETLSVSMVPVGGADPGLNKTRYFISIFTRTILSQTSNGLRDLQWRLIEIDRTGARPAADEYLGRPVFEPCPGLDCGIWLAQSVAAEIGLDGKIHWRLIAFDRKGAFD